MMALTRTAGYALAIAGMYADGQPVTEVSGWKATSDNQLPAK